MVKSIPGSLQTGGQLFYWCRPLHAHRQAISLPVSLLSPITIDNNRSGGRLWHATKFHQG